ncbi:BTAD domain-containing putative transcriptional regulator [Actinomyces israelii]|uniref:BTAD domain-containing putative transcriptional regulator n=1 Tax=Actinomyces israelii TaxID=1659 RepID=A0ABT4IBT9_9ACTO|nr:BTAD domain-containing putative transcriptional regulator [Actinomyces israelii]MCZ0859213.1 BTAD domain-containing putative transcriptional regulator [Actinomyces israelii]
MEESNSAFVRLLGPVRVLDADGTAIRLSGRRTAALVARLALSAGVVVPAETLLDDIWEDDIPDGGTETLRRLASRTRSRLAKHRLAVGPVPNGGGYRFVIEPMRVDAHRFEHLVTEGARLLRENAPARANEALVQALSLWGGAPLSGIRSEFALHEAARLEDLHLQGQEDRLVAVSSLEGPEAAVGDLQSLASAFPLRERTHYLLMRALHDSGQRGAALAAYDRLRHSLNDKLGVAPARRVTSLYEEILRDEQATPTGWRSPYLTRAVARDREIHLIDELMDRTRLVTLTGTGGVGKTRLAVEYATRATDRLSGHGPAPRICFVGLAALRDGDSLEEGVSAALSTHDMLTPSRSPARILRIASALSDMPTLLILDNCEHVIEPAAALVSELLPLHPDLRILATSREPLMVAGEAVLRVPPLPLPDGSGASSGAVELFEQLAGLSDPSFCIHDGNRALVEYVCRRLDGLPLAIELAATRTRSMGIEGIAGHLNEMFQLLSSARRTDSTRQRSLRATLDWSWDLLSPDERILARRLAWFPAGARVETAEHICAGGDLPQEEVPFLLSSLVDRSLLTISSSSDTQARYQLLETTRRYLLLRLDEAGETDRIAHSAVEYFRDRLQDTFRGLLYGCQAESLAWLDAEYDNIVEAMRQLDRAEDLVAFVIPLSWYWIMHGRVDEISRQLRELEPARDALPTGVVLILDLVASLCPGQDDSGGRRPLWSGVDADTLRTYPPLVMIACKSALLAGDLTAVASLLEIAHDHEEPWVRAAGHAAQSIAAETAGDTEAAEKCAETAAAEFNKIGDHWSAGHMVTLIARHRSRRGDLDGAVEALRDSATMEERSGVVTVLAQVELGRLLVRAGRTEEGRRVLSRTLGQACNISAEYRILAHVGMMAAALDDEDTRAAGTSLAEVREVMAARLVSDPEYLKVEIELVTARLYLQRGQVRLAEAAIREAAAGVAGVAYPALDADVIDTTALVLEATRRPEMAARALGMADRLRGGGTASGKAPVVLGERLTQALGTENFRWLYDEGRATGLGATGVWALAADDEPLR